MNPSQETSVVQTAVENQPIHKNILNRKGNFIIVLGIILVIVVIGIAGYYLGTRENQPTGQYNPQLTTLYPTVSQIPQSNLNDFFLFSIPKPYKDLTVYQLPNTMNPINVVQYRDSLWFAGDGSLVEYDTKSGKLVSYSNMTKANCDSNVVMVNNFLFTSCHTDNIEDAFGHTEQLTSKIYTGHYSIFKINPLTHQVEYIFTDKDGLQNRYNYALVADGDSVWVQTFKGIGRINAKTNKVSFYPDSQINIHFGIGSIVPDDKYVWAYSVDTGLALFDKAIGTWQKFTDEEAIGRTGYPHLDTRPFGNAVKLVPGGLQLGIYAGDQATDNCLIRKYDYATKQWSTTMAQQVKYVSNCEDVLKPNFNTHPTYTITDQSGLTQIQLPGSSKQYQIDGRDNYILSPMIGNKRYILTSATVDVIDDSSAFRQILVKLGGLPSSGVSYGDPSAYEGLVSFLIDSDNSLAVVTDSACGGQGCSGKEKVWLIDLKSAKINRIYTKADGIDGELLFGLSMNRDDDLLVVKDKNGIPLFNINTTNNNITVLKK